VLFGLGFVSVFLWFPVSRKSLFPVFLSTRERCSLLFSPHRHVDPVSRTVLSLFPLVSCCISPPSTSSLLKFCVRSSCCASLPTPVHCGLRPTTALAEATRVCVPIDRSGGQPSGAQQTGAGGGAGLLRLRAVEPRRRRGSASEAQTRYGDATTQPCVSAPRRYACQRSTSAQAPAT
jgi:hypothetical protein